MLVFPVHGGKWLTDAYQEVPFEISERINEPPELRVLPIDETTVVVSDRE